MGHLSPKFLKKYALIAKSVGEIENPCHSRKIGVVIVKDGRIVGTGYNGPPRGTPHCDTEAYLREYLLPQLNEDEQHKLLDAAKERTDYSLGEYVDKDGALGRACKALAGCGECPRRLLGIPSGQKLELCSCEHGERNAIYNATGSVVGGIMVCWCGVPCLDCTKAIINSQISTVYCHKAPLYSPQSPWLFREAGVELIEYDQDAL